MISSLSLSLASLAPTISMQASPARAVANARPRLLLHSPRGASLRRPTAATTPPSLGQRFSTWCVRLSECDQQHARALRRMSEAKPSGAWGLDQGVPGSFGLIEAFVRGGGWSTAERAEAREMSRWAGFAPNGPGELLAGGSLGRGMRHDPAADVRRHSRSRLDALRELYPTRAKLSSPFTARAARTTTARATPSAPPVRGADPLRLTRDPAVDPVAYFTQVLGIGETTARRWAAEGCCNFRDVLTRDDVPGSGVSLTVAQYEAIADHLRRWLVREVERAFDAAGPGYEGWLYSSADPRVERPLLVIAMVRSERHVQNEG